MQRQWLSSWAAVTKSQSWASIRDTVKESSSKSAAIVVCCIWNGKVSFSSTVTVSLREICGMRSASGQIRVTGSGPFTAASAPQDVVLLTGITAPRTVKLFRHDLWHDPTQTLRLLYGPDPDAHPACIWIAEFVRPPLCEVAAFYSDASGTLW